MAKAVRSQRPRGNPRNLIAYPPIPAVSKLARKAYEEVLQDRLERFPATGEPHIVVISSENPASWSHELRHDAESAFWLLVRWAVMAFPKDYEPTLISNSTWASLNDTFADNRPYKIQPETLHPEYLAMHELINEVGHFLSCDIYWAKVEPYIYNDFVHEVFQRLLLNFIAENQNEGFMDLPKSIFARPVRPGGK